MRRVISEKRTAAAPFFSIVIPTRDEAEDILVTLRSIRDNGDGDFEVLVVDASSDDTPRIVQGFGDPRFRLLPQDNRDGRCGARNQGIRAARGEVVVILNADARLPEDFLARARKHYDAGADYLIVDSRVENSGHPFGAMVEAEHRHLYRSGREAMNWCEGYSCRRRCAIEAGLFPEKYPVPICAGEDAVFGESMAKRFRRAEDMSIVVPHAVPEDLRAFWAQRIGRGEGCAQRRILLDGWPLSKAIGDGFLWGIKTLLWLLLLAPWIRYAAALRRRLPEAPLPGLLWAVFLSRAGHEVGRGKGLCRLWRKFCGVECSSMNETRDRWRLDQPKLVWGLLGILLAAHLLWGWDRWGDFNWDSAREMTTPRRILAGDRPWRDFEMIYGPLSYFATAGFMHFFGDSFWVDRGVMGALVLGTGIFLALAGAKILPRFYLSWMLVAWAGVFVFPPAFCSMSALLLPYSSCGTWTSLWLALTVLLGGRHAATGGRGSWAGLAVVASVAPFICKLEATAAIGLATVSLLFWKGKGSRLERTMVLAVTGAIVTSAGLLMASAWISPPELFERVTASVKSQGQGNPGEFPLKATIRLVLLFAAVGAIVHWAERAREAARQRRASLAVLLIVSGGAFALLAFWHRDTLFIQACLILFLAPWIGLGACLYDKLRDKEVARELPWYCLVGIFAAFRFAVDGHVYPFVFLVAANLPATFAAGHRLIGQAIHIRRLRIAVMLPFMLGGAILASDSLAKYRLPWLTLETPYGRLRCACRSAAHLRQAKVWQEAALWIREHDKATGPKYLFSLSPGYVMCLLTGHLPPQYTLNSGLLAVRYSDGKLRSPLELGEIEAIRSRSPNFAVLDSTPIWAATLGATRPLLHEGKIPGALFFGDHYLPSIHAYILDHYSTVLLLQTSMGEGAPPYRLTIMRKKDAGQP
ncbi:MAG: glycosyltransferase family 2 protein [Verrucomicrobiae bacterium]|nr:glycosyltransferase family 2 protein [Verrucomicrobiae bacterium]